MLTLLSLLISLQQPPTDRSAPEFNSVRDQIIQDRDLVPGFGAGAFTKEPWPPELMKATPTNPGPTVATFREEVRGGGGKYLRITVWISSWEHDYKGLLKLSHKGIQSAVRPPQGSLSGVKIGQYVESNASKDSCWLTAGQGRFLVQLNFLTGHPQDSSPDGVKSFETYRRKFIDNLAISILKRSRTVSLPRSITEQRPNTFRLAPELVAVEDQIIGFPRIKPDFVPGNYATPSPEKPLLMLPAKGNPGPRAAYFECYLQGDDTKRPGSFLHIKLRLANRDESVQNFLGWFTTGRPALTPARSLTGVPIGDFVESENKPGNFFLTAAKGRSAVSIDYSCIWPNLETRQREDAYWKRERKFIDNLAIEILNRGNKIRLPKELKDAALAKVN